MERNERNAGFFSMLRETLKLLLKIQLVWMSRLEVVQNDVEIVRRQNALAGWIQVVLIIGMWRRAWRRARRRIRLLVIVRQLHTGHPDGTSHVFMYTVALTRAAGR